MINLFPKRTELEVNNLLVTDPKEKEFQNHKTDKSLRQDKIYPRVLEECGSSLSKHGFWNFTIRLQKSKHYTHI